MAVAYNPLIVTNGLVLALDAGNVKSYPGSGTTWTSLGNLSNDATLQNAPTFNTSYFSFDGTNDFVSSATSFTPVESIYYTNSVWFRTSTASGRKLIGIEDSQTGTTAGNYDKMLYMGTNGKVHHALYPNSYQLIQSTNALNDGVWHNATGTYDGTDMRLYIDGKLDGTLASSASTMNTNGWWRLASYKLATWSNAGDGYYIGDIAVAYVYHRALSAAEIQQNFNALRGRYGI